AAAETGASAGAEIRARPVARRPPVGAAFMPRMGYMAATRRACPRGHPDGTNAGIGRAHGALLQSTLLPGIARMPYTPILATLGYVLSPDRKQVLMVHRNARPGDLHL